MAAEVFWFMETGKEGHVRYNLGEANVSGVWHHLLMSKLNINVTRSREVIQGRKLENG